MFKYKKRGQISIDFIIAFLFLMLVSLYVAHTIFSYNDNMRKGIIADKLESIADTFENYAILSYTENETLTLKLKPIGVKSYTIYFGNKKIVVNTTKYVIFNPIKNGVNVKGDVKDSGLHLNKVINITYNDGKDYITKNISINID